jgi:AP2-associated kinase
VLTVGSHKAVIKKYISEGGFAHVYMVEITPTENNSSIACLKRVAVPDKPSLNNLRAEVDSMKRLAGYRHIVSYIDSHAARMENGQGYEVFVLMEYCANKGLIDFMNTRLHNRLTEPEVLRIMGEVTEGVANMHALNPPLVHRDIKIENVLISDNGDYKLCDFGSASPVLRPPRNSDEFAVLQNDVLKNTTPQYRSPEMVDLYRGLPIDEKSDIWALGIFLYKLCYYTTPFEAQGELAILHAKFEFPSNPQYSDRLKNLISVLLREDPRRRPNAYQTLEEVCRMRRLPVPIHDYTKIRSTPAATPSSSDLLRAKSADSGRGTASPLPPLQASNTQLRPPQPLGYSSSYGSSKHPLAPMPSNGTPVGKVDPFQSNKNEFFNSRSQSSPPRPSRPKTIHGFSSLNKSLGSLSLSSSKPIAPPKSIYVDSVVQTDDPEATASARSRMRSSSQYPKSIYASSSQSESRSNSLGKPEQKELQKILTGISTKSTTVELSPGENGHIGSNMDFLKSLQHQDSGKSWVQQTTGGSINSLRRISTGSKKRSSLMGQLTGKLSRTHSRNSSRASSIHESSGVYSSQNGGSSAKYRSSSESIEEENMHPTKPKKLTRSSSIQRRIQGLLSRQGDPPVVKTAKGYGNDALNDSSTGVKVTNNDLDGFKKPALFRKGLPVPKRKLVPQTPPLSAQSTTSTVTKTPGLKSVAVQQSSSPATLKKAPPKPKKPSHLKANSKSPSVGNISDSSDNDRTLTRSLSRSSDMSRVSDVSLPDIDDLERNFNNRFPSAV